MVSDTDSIISSCSQGEDRKGAENRYSANLERSVGLKGHLVEILHAGIIVFGSIRVMAGASVAFCLALLTRRDQLRDLVSL